MDSTNFSDVFDFHAKFGLPCGDRPAPLADDVARFRVGFMQEELDEYKRAVEAGDLAKQCDALVDLVYVAMGTAVMQGFPWQEVWREVHAANMRKERASDAADSRSTRGHALDVVKPNGWTPPNVAAVLGLA